MRAARVRVRLKVRAGAGAGSPFTLTGDFFYCCANSKSKQASKKERKIRDDSTVVHKAVHTIHQFKRP